MTHLVKLPRLSPTRCLCVRDAAALDLTLALGPFDTSPEIMCERGAGEGERLYTFGEPVRRWDEENSIS